LFYENFLLGAFDNLVADTAMINSKFEVYRTRTGQFRWRLRAGNGEIIAHGESYKRRIDCMAAIKLVKQSDLASVE